MLKCYFKTKIVCITHAFVIESHKSNSRNARILSKGKSDAYINVPVHYRRVITDIAHLLVFTSIFQIKCLYLLVLNSEILSILENLIHVLLGKKMSIIMYQERES